MSAAHGQNTDGAVYELQQYRTAFDNQMSRINSDYTNNQALLQKQYGKSLEALLVQIKQGGDAEAASIVDQEKKRFAAENDVLPEHLSENSDLLALQQKYQETGNSLSLKKAKQIDDLAKQYDQSLSRMQLDFIRRNNLAGAGGVKKERESVMELPEVTAARSVLEQADVDVSAVEELSKKEEEAAPETAVKEKTAKKKYSGSAKNYVRQRFSGLCDNMTKGKWTEARSYIVPDYVKEKGTNIVEMQMKMLFPFMRFANRKGVSLSCKDVRVYEESGTATLVPKIWVNNEWYDLNITEWVEKDGDWFLVMTPGLTWMPRIEKDGEEQDLVPHPMEPNPVNRKQRRDK